ncbi:MAG: NUDIX hydrolase [Acidiferrobacteraceae bacterium]|jgi:isopentenyldiphosphate isomerase|nr:NUDIX hydrolase [Acidiferrobacteraceae bacterium]|tara:strand:- start:8526 stop:9065 length:540 start_codon:yes stop_codon:yes gene_type:complete
MNKHRSVDQSELLVVVNAEDQVIGAKKRDDVHRLGLRHRSVHILVFDLKARLFLQKRSLYKDNNPGLWDSSVAGHVDDGESYDDCCVREIQEEIGIQLGAPPDRLFKIDACPESGMEFSWVYKLITSATLNLNYEEIEMGRWVEPRELDRMLLVNESTFAETFPIIWKRYKAYMKNISH